MEFSDLLEIFQKYGASTTIGTIIMFGLYYIVFKSTWFSSFMTKVSDKILDNFMKKKTNEVTQVKSITESDIINHDIFNLIDFWMYSKIPTFQFSTEYRTVVFRKYLTIFLKKHKENIQTYVTNRSFEKLDESQLWTSFLSLINDIIYDYEKEMEYSGIPKVIIEKMKAKNNDTISLTIDLIEGICTSQFYASDKNLLKVYSILNIMLSILENTISSSDHICNSINGSLSGLTYTENNITYREP